MSKGASAVIGIVVVVLGLVGGIVQLIAYVKYLTFLGTAKNEV